MLRVRGWLGWLGSGGCWDGQGRGLVGMVRVRGLAGMVKVRVRGLVGMVWVRVRGSLICL